MRRRGSPIISLLAFAAAAGVMWGIAWFGMGIVLVIKILLPPPEGTVFDAVACFVVCSLISAAGAGVALAAGRLERYALSPPRGERRGFEVLGVHGAASNSPPEESSPLGGESRRRV